MQAPPSYAEARQGLQNDSHFRYWWAGPRLVSKENLGPLVPSAHRDSGRGGLTGARLHVHITWWSWGGHGGWKRCDFAAWTLQGEGSWLLNNSLQGRGRHGPQWRRQRDVQAQSQWGALGLHCSAATAAVHSEQMEACCHLFVIQMLTKLKFLIPLKTQVNYPRYNTEHTGL